MPAAFDECQANGGEIRTVSGPDDKAGLAEGEYVHICVLDGKSVRGEVKQEKAAKAATQMTAEEIAILKTLAGKFAETPSGPDAHQDGWVDCPTCGEKMPKDATKCPDCGAKVAKNAKAPDPKAADTKTCPECDAEIPADATECPEGGADLSGDSGGAGPVFKCHDRRCRNVGYCIWCWGIG